MKQALVRMTQHPQIKAAGIAIAAEVANVGVFGLYDRFMDALAHKIAVYMHELEKKERTKE